MTRKFGKIVYDSNRARFGTVVSHSIVEDKDGAVEEVTYREFRSGRNYKTDCFKVINSLRFFRDGNTIIASVMINGRRVPYLGQAFCRKGDSYKAWVGRRLALARALNDEDGEELIMSEAFDKTRYAACPTEDEVEKANGLRCSYGDCVNCDVDYSASSDEYSEVAEQPSEKHLD